MVESLPNQPTTTIPTGVILHGNIYLGFRIFRFCVMPWKDEREPTIKYCLGGQVDVVQKFTTIQSFGHN